MKFFVLLIASACLTTINARSVEKKDESPSNGVPYSEELVVESALNIRPKGKEEIVRQKRQFDFGQSQAQANANAFNQQFGPNGFGASAANAGAQAFNSQGPLGSFGAAAGNSASQGFHAGPGGFGANAAFTGSQTYNLPNKHTVGVSYGGSFANNNGQASGSTANGVTFS